MSENMSGHGNTDGDPAIPLAAITDLLPEEYNQIVDALPFGPKVEPDFRDSNIGHSRRLLESMGSTGVRAAYDDYYGVKIYRFYSGDEISSSLMEDVVAIPRREWDKYNIVQSGAEAYAEPTTTKHFEPDAVLYTPASTIEEAHQRLQAADLPREQVVEALKILGQTTMALRGVRRMEADVIRGLAVEKSIIVRGPNKDSLIVHTPIKGIDVDSLQRGKLSLAQGQGQVNSTQFNRDGSYKPAGLTHELRYDRAGIPNVQVKWLRRRIGNNQPTRKEPPLPPTKQG